METLTLKEMLACAQKNNFGVGSFSPRNLDLIEPILIAAKEQKSPVIVQISSNELRWVGLTHERFSEKFYKVVKKYDIPVTLHLDHTADLEGIKKAIDAKFTSVMIDASKLTLEENIALTRSVVDYAHNRGVSVEAELGKIGATDKIETDNDVELYTVPEEAAYFVEKTGVDALAISIGTAHGVYLVANPTIDFDRLAAIRKLVDIPLVLHGGSGLSFETVKKAIDFPGGGFSKINIATDLELAFLAALGIKERMLYDDYERFFSPEQIKKAGLSVQKTTEDKIKNYMFSDNKAEFYRRGLL